MTTLGAAVAIFLVVQHPAPAQPPAPSFQSSAKVDCRRAADLPGQFPFDSYVFRARVLEPVMPLARSQTQTWVVRVELTLPVHVPEPRRRFDLLLRHDDCQTISRAQLIDLYVSGDVLEIAAFAEHGAALGAAERQGAPVLLSAPAGWVRLMDENTSSGIDTPFEYFAALFNLESRDDDSHRALGMRRIADYLDTEEQFDAVLERYIDGKHLRKQLRSVYKGLHPVP